MSFLFSFSYFLFKNLLFLKLRVDHFSKIIHDSLLHYLISQVRAIYDVKGIDMGNSLVRYKAELDFDGRELTRSYLDKHDLNAMIEVRIGKKLKFSRINVMTIFGNILLNMRRINRW